MKKLDIKKMIKEELKNALQEHEVSAGTYQTFLLHIESMKKYIIAIEKDWVKYEQTDDIKLIERAYGNSLAVQSTIEGVLEDLTELTTEHNRIAGA